VDFRKNLEETSTAAATRFRVLDYREREAALENATFAEILEALEGVE
jgi:hypothetical protein